MPGVGSRPADDLGRRAGRAARPVGDSRRAQSCAQRQRPEFIARAIREFLALAGVETLYIEPGSPWQNGYAESFHSRLRSELLDAEVFDSVAAAQGLGTAWRSAYNHQRPHSGLGYRTPAEFAAGGAASAPATGLATPNPAPPLQQHRRNEETLTIPQPLLS